MTSMLALQCSINRAMKTNTLGAGQFVEFILTREWNKTWHEDDVNCRNTHFQWRYDRRSGHEW